MPEAAQESGWLPRKRYLRVATWLLGVIAVILVGWALRATTIVTLPLVFAFFIALAVWPLDAWVQRQMPIGLHWVGHVFALSVILLFLGLFLAGLFLAAQQVASDLPKHAEQFPQWVSNLPEMLSALVESNGRSATQQQGASAGGALDGSLVALLRNYALGILQGLWTTVGGVVLIFFFVLLMLIEAPRWNAKIENGISGDHRPQWRLSISMTAARFRWYLLVRTGLGLLTAALYVFWLWVWGVELLLVWGLLAFLLNFLPTIGSLIAGSAAVAFAFLQKDFGIAIAVASGLFAIEQVLGNFVDPRLQGKQLAISPLVVLVALMFWGWVWGVPGALIAVPVTVLIIIACLHSRTLAPVALFLSDAESVGELRRKSGMRSPHHSRPISNSSQE